MKLLALASFMSLGLWAQNLEVLPVRGNVYMFASDAGNVAVQIGEFRDNDGVLVVDSGDAQRAEGILAEIKKMTRKPVRYVVNTSSDPDHTGGNVALGNNGTRVGLITGGGTTAQVLNVYSQDNTLTRLAEAKVPEAALPTMTFEQLKDFSFNGEGIQLISVAPAHTDGDAIVFFRGSNVIATGDIFSTEGYPVIDLTRGGSINGEVKALNRLLELTVPEITQEGGTMVIPGHGRLCDEADVTEYRDMVTIVRDRVAAQIAKGKTVDQVKAARITRDYDGRYGKPNYTGDMFVEAIYKSLKAEGSK